MRDDDAKLAEAAVLIIRFVTHPLQGALAKAISERQGSEFSPNGGRIARESGRIASWIDADRSEAPRPKFPSEVARYYQEVAEEGDDR
jgi:hypothetical protein